MDYGQFGGHMADIVDDAERQQQNLLDAAIKERCRKANFDINGDGICLSCGMIVEPVLSGMKIITPRWCCVECRTAWEREDD